MSLLLANVPGAAAAPLAWKPLPSVPEPKGFAGSFAGVSGCALLVAGGDEARPGVRSTEVWFAAHGPQPTTKGPP
ncbi:MAG TPA: hypothetical protein PLU30_16605 [Verrucomicrobiae bacterium]|nr:hypothetical protein [Verrucomicrobiae bacterium]